MRHTVWGLVLMAGFGLVLWSGYHTDAQTPRRPALPPLPGHRQAAKSMVALGFEQASGPHTVVVVDPQTQALSVYHVDRTTGAIALKSVRNVQWDLRIEEFNGANPTPREIRSLIERR